MMLPSFRKLALCGMIGLLSVATNGSAQLSNVFSNVFKTILDDRLRLSGSPGQHGTHFQKAAALAESTLTPALNTLISRNIGSFPLSSTSAGITFDFSSGLPVSITESMGPIFAELGQTFGQGKLNIGFNYNYLDLSRFRGIRTQDMRFTFTHQDVGAPGLGDSPNESDILDVTLDLNVNASIFALFATLGVTNNFDVGVAVPIVHVELNGNARAHISSFTYAYLGAAYHQFGKDTLNPVLDTTVPYDESVTGLGDIAFRFKYGSIRAADMDIAALLDVRLPTGKKENFLGSGKTNVRLLGILSRRIGDFTPHLNVGFEYRGEREFESNVIQFASGFDQKVTSGLTFAMSVLGQFDIESSKAIKLFPGTVRIVDRIVRGGIVVGQNPRDIGLSNVPDRNNDNLLTLSTGFRYAPSEQLILLGNVLVPLNAGGLRPVVAPTIGLSVNL